MFVLTLGGGELVTYSVDKGLQSLSAAKYHYRAELAQFNVITDTKVAYKDWPCLCNKAIKK